jgi:hypothetical protein
VYVSAALLLKFAPKLKGMKFQELVTFIQKLPTREWQVSASWGAGRRWPGMGLDAACRRRRGGWWPCCRRSAHRSGDPWTIKLLKHRWRCVQQWTLSASSPPTLHLQVKDLEELLAQSYVYKTMFDSSPSHLA